ncbi:amidohydrolase family protein [Bordetella petrii]|uniref:amidohydrolase family protein n=1 Tax=Bordetella petrii TaxID=94624 RepID=UPI001A974007|nr:amidohydrolase family protein [Bordetella petrii]MBO1113034.1 amidohydrolase family protein [Bordetella petrii]
MTYLPFDAALKPARQRLPAGACDCHFHIFESPGQYPLAAGRAYTPTPAPRASYQALRAAYGIDRAVLVHPSVYGADHASYEALLAEHAAWLRGVAVAYAHTPDEDIARWHRLGTRGTRVNVLFQGGPTQADIDSIIDKISPHGWHVQLFGDLSRVPDLAPRIAGRVPVVVDHIGHGQPGQLIGSAGFANLLALLREGRAWVKLSAPYRSSADAPAYPEVRPLVDAILDANPAQAVWGTDWPHPHIPGPMPNDGDLVDLVYDWLPDASIRQAVLVDNPARLYWRD